MTSLPRVLFLGSKQTGLRCLRCLHTLAPESLAGIVTLDDRADSRTAFDEFQRFAGEAGIPLSVARNRRESEAAIREYRPDLCMVMGWYWLVSPDVLASVPRGFLGIHFSLLPKYRGGSPLVWQMINGDPVVGLSLFSFTEGIDQGDIWGQRSVSVGPADYISDVLAKLEEESISLLNDIFVQILHQRVRPSRQDDDQATYCAMREPSDGAIDWQRSATDVYNFIRAQSSPYPGAFTRYEGRKLTVWRARPHPSVYYARPGQVIAVRPDGVLAACGGNSAIILESAQLEGNESLPAHQVIRSVKTRLPD